MNVHQHKSRAAKRPYIGYCLIVSLLILAVSLIILALVPPISRDALTHHLYVPRLYLQHGGLFQIPDVVFSYFPMNLDLLYMGALYLGSDILPKYIHMFFGLATAYLIYKYLKPRLPLHYALLGAVFFLSIPIIVKLSITVYVDLGLVFFTTASLLLLFRWIERDFQYRYLIFSGLCCGLAVGTKYNGLIVYFLLTLLVPILYLRSQESSHAKTTAAVRFSLVFFLCALVAVSPWFIRNIIWTGNPIYPLFDSFFNPTAVANAVMTDEGSSIRGVFATRRALYGENLWQLLMLPIRIFFEGMDDDPRHFDGRLNPFLLLLPLLAFIRGPAIDKKIQIEKVILSIFCLLYFLFAFNTGSLRIRYLVPMVPALAILAMFGLDNVEHQLARFIPNRHIQLTLWLLPVILMLGYNGRYIYQQFQVITPFSYITGQISRDEYVTKFRPEYKVMQYANSNLPQSAKILCVFLGRRGYYLERDHIFEDNSSNKLLLTWLREKETNPAELVNSLKQHGITHIMVRTDLFSQWLEQNLVGDRRAMFTEFVNRHLVLVALHLDYSLYKIGK